STVNPSGKRVAISRSTNAWNSSSETSGAEVRDSPKNRTDCTSAAARGALDAQANPETTRTRQTRGVRIGCRGFTRVRRKRAWFVVARPGTRRGYQSLTCRVKQEKRKQMPAGARR